LEAAGIVANYNAIPFDPHPPFYSSGLRLGTPAITSRGMKEAEMYQVAYFITEILNELSVIKKRLKYDYNDERNIKVRKKIISKAGKIKANKKLVKKLCQAFPIPDKY